MRLAFQLSFEIRSILCCLSCQQCLVFDKVLVQFTKQNLCTCTIQSSNKNLHEKRYNLHSGKLEFLALKWAIYDEFRDLLYYASSFTTYTDNNPLTYVVTSAKLKATGQFVKSTLPLSKLFYHFVSSLRLYEEPRSNIDELF